MDTVLACFALAGLVGSAPGSITGVTVGLLHVETYANSLQWKNPLLGKVAGIKRQW